MNRHRRRGPLRRENPSSRDRIRQFGRAEKDLLALVPAEFGLIGRTLGKGGADMLATRRGYRTNHGSIIRVSYFDPLIEIDASARDAHAFVAYCRYWLRLNVHR
jgi:hypothetical protein